VAPSSSIVPQRSRTGAGGIVLRYLLTWVTSFPPRIGSGSIAPDIDTAIAIARTLGGHDLQPDSLHYPVGRCQIAALPPARTGPKLETRCMLACTRSHHVRCQGHSPSSVHLDPVRPGSP
jgi:hypothetical protein